ncbi:hypothetical protein B7494_g1004 [Chlorociboria aeruginascens]|nr:hypothetical protein B7494_g1004 [Chlorociboria aeruginascens]
MSSIALAKYIRNRRTTASIQFPLLYPTTYSVRASSINAGISRGLRRSKNVGFRGKEKSQPRYRENSRPNLIVRRTAEPPSHAFGSSPLTKRGWEGNSQNKRSELIQEWPGRVRHSKETDKREKFSRGKSVVGRPNREGTGSERPRRNELRRKNTREERRDREIASRETPSGEWQGRDGRSRLRVATEAPRWQQNNQRDPESQGRFQKEPQESRFSRPESIFEKKRSGFQGSTIDAINRKRKETDMPIIGRSGNPGSASGPWQSKGVNRDDKKSTSPFRAPSRSLRWSQAENPESRSKERTTYPSHRPINEKSIISYGTRPPSEENVPREKYGNPKEDIDAVENEPRIARNRLPVSVPYTTPASEFLYGTSVVEAALSSRRPLRRKLYKLYIYKGENRENAQQDAALARLAKKNNIDVQNVDGPEWLRILDRMSSGRPHNGYVLESSPLPRRPITSLGELTAQDNKFGFEVMLDYQSREDAAVNGTSTFAEVSSRPLRRKPLVLLLDGIVDPGNLGGILRTASFLGVAGIAISTHHSASFTPVVLKASAGASENLTLFSVNKPAGFIVDSKRAGWTVYAAMAPSRDGPYITHLTTDSLDDPLSRGPCILMLGAEGEGLRKNLGSKADVQVSIPGNSRSSTVDSLNVSVAAGILCNSFLRPAGRNSGKGDVDRNETEEERPFEATKTEDPLDLF